MSVFWITVPLPSGFSLMRVSDETHPVIPNASSDQETKRKSLMNATSVKKMSVLDDSRSSTYAAAHTQQYIHRSNRICQIINEFPTQGVSDLLNLIVLRMW